MTDQQESTLGAISKQMMARSRAAISKHMESMSKDESDIYGWMSVLDKLAQADDDIGVAIEMVSSRIKYHMEGISDGRNAVAAIARNGITESGEPVWDRVKMPNEVNQH